MPVIAKFNVDTIFKDVLRKVELITAAVEEALEMVCLEIVRKAKTEYGTGSPEKAGQPHQPDYIEWTHYLKGSIGYVVYSDGQKIAENFGGDNAGGAEKGRKLATSVAGQYPKGFVAVIVAGSEYAAYVESRGYSVLTGATSDAGKLLEKYMKAAVEAIKG